jgi:hypothetical protein
MRIGLMLTNQDVAGIAFGTTGREQRRRREVRCRSASAPLPLGSPPFRSPLRALSSPVRALGSPVRAKRRTLRASARAKESSRMPGTKTERKVLEDQITISDRG